MNTLEKVKEIVSKGLNVDKEKILEETTLESLGADSLDVVELVMEFEEAFDIEIADKDAEQLETISEIVNYIENK